MASDDLLVTMPASTSFIDFCKVLTRLDVGPLATGLIVLGNLGMAEAGL